MNRRDFLKGLGATFASLWCLGAKRPEPEEVNITVSLVAEDKPVYEAKTSVDPPTEVARTWDDNCYFLAEPIYPSSCQVCDQYFCSPNCPNYKECGVDEPCSPDCPIPLEDRRQYKHCQYKPFAGLDKIVNTGYQDIQTCRLCEPTCPHWETRKKDCHDIATGVPEGELRYQTESPQRWFGDIERIETPDPDSPGQFITVAEIRDVVET